MITAVEIPEIIQGGMGVAVSSWRLARPFRTEMWGVRSVAHFTASPMAVTPMGSRMRQS